MLCEDWSDVCRSRQYMSRTLLGFKADSFTWALALFGSVALAECHFTTAKGWIRKISPFILPSENPFPFTNEGWTCQTDPRVYLLTNKSCGVEKASFCILWAFPKSLWLTERGTYSNSGEDDPDDHVFKFILHIITGNQRQINQILQFISVQVVNDWKCFRKNDSIAHNCHCKISIFPLNSHIRITNASSYKNTHTKIKTKSAWLDVLLQTWLQEAAVCFSGMWALEQ